jgi:hypothetical protein
MKIKKNEKPEPINLNTSTDQKHNTDFEKKLHLENSKVFKKIYGVRPPKTN